MVTPRGGPAYRKLAREQGQAKRAGSSVDAWAVDHAAYGPGEQVELSRISQRAAANLTVAHAIIPAVTHHDKTDVSVLESFRKSLASQAEQRGVKLTAMPFYILALAKALAAYPRMNCAWLPDGQRLWQRKYCDIAIAVDTEHGLQVPVIRDCWRKKGWTLAAELADLAQRARAGKIRPAELGGASMTITNLGGIGGTAFTPIINPPQAAILGLARTQIEPRWNGKSFDPAPMLPLALTYDHRIADGALAARFVKLLAELIADPRRMIFA